MRSSWISHRATSEGIWNFLLEWNILEIGKEIEKQKENQFGKKSTFFIFLSTVELHGYLPSNCWMLPRDLRNVLQWILNSRLPVGLHCHIMGNKWTCYVKKLLHCLLQIISGWQTICPLMAWMRLETMKIIFCFKVFSFWSFPFPFFFFPAVFYNWKTQRRGKTSD